MGSKVSWQIHLEDKEVLNQLEEINRAPKPFKRAIITTSLNECGIHYREA